jgi:hypothetical protein
VKGSRSLVAAAVNLAMSYNKGLDRDNDRVACEKP